MDAPYLTALPPELRLTIFEATRTHETIELGMLGADKRLHMLSGPRDVLSMAQTCSEFRREALPVFCKNHVKIRFLSDLRNDTTGITSEHTAADIHEGVVQIQKWFRDLGYNQRYIKSVSVDLGYEPQYQRLGIEPPRYEPKTTVPIALKSLKKAFTDIGFKPELLITFGMNFAQCDWPLYEIQVNMQLAGPEETMEAFRKAARRYWDEHPELVAHPGHGSLPVALAPFQRLMETLMSDEEWKWSKGTN